MASQLLAEVVNLDISSWIGIGIGASHYYGKLEARGKDSVEMFNILTRKQAIELRKEDSLSPYCAGDNYRGFDCRDDAIAKAREVWRDHFPDAQFLVLGRAANVEPKRLLDSLPGVKIKTRVNALVRRYDKVMSKYEGWRNYRKPISAKDEQFMDDSYSDWVRLLNDAST